MNTQMSSKHLAALSGFLLSIGKNGTKSAYRRTLQQKMIPFDGFEGFAGVTCHPIQIG